MIEPRLNPIDPEMNHEYLDPRSTVAQQGQTGRVGPSWPELTVDQVRILVHYIKRAATKPERQS